MTLPDPWPFDDPPNVACFTSRRIFEQGDWIHYVTHDEDDGGWQFHPPSAPTPMSDAWLVGLGNIVKRDPTIVELADLPLGWHAWRDAPDAPWQRGVQPPREPEPDPDPSIAFVSSGPVAGHQSQAQEAIARFIHNHGGPRRLARRIGWDDLDGFRRSSGAPIPAVWVVDGAHKRPPHAPPGFLLKWIEFDGLPTRAWPVHVGPNARRGHIGHVPGWFAWPAIVLPVAAIAYGMRAPAGWPTWPVGAAFFFWLVLFILLLLAINLKIPNAITKWWLVANERSAELVKLGPRRRPKRRIPITRDCFVIAAPFSMPRTKVTAPVSTADWLIFLPDRPHFALARGLDPTDTPWGAGVAQVHTDE